MGGFSIEPQIEWSSIAQGDIEIWTVNGAGSSIVLPNSFSVRPTISKLFTSVTFAMAARATLESVFCSVVSGFRSNK